LFREAEREREKLFRDPEITTVYKDSINFFLGLTYYNEKKMNEAHQHLISVSDQTFLFYKSHYLAGLIDMDRNKADSAFSNYYNIGESTNNDLNELRLFELSGLSLLTKNYARFDSLSANLSFKNELLGSEYENFKKYYAVDKKIKRRSPFLAGTLSAIVPGLGKVYAGNNGQALASFLTCGLMGAVTAENYIHFGIEHPQTIFFAGLFSIFYIGNIWGSAVSVQLVKTEKQLENKHNILVGLKIPVDRFFN
jgi:hypothetical protein